MIPAHVETDDSTHQSLPPPFRQQDFTPETVREKRVIQSLSDFFGF